MNKLASFLRKKISIKNMKGDLYTGYCVYLTGEVVVIEVAKTKLKCIPLYHVDCITEL